MSKPFRNSVEGGFVAVTLDLPFGIALPAGVYLVRDPRHERAVIQPVLREGSRVFFRNMPIIGPTSFKELQQRAKDFEQPRQDHTYMATSVLADGSEKATMNIHAGQDGGFAEAKYFSEVHITFLEEDLNNLNQQGYVMDRVAPILNRFLDIYRLVTEDCRVSHVSDDRNFYLAVCRTSQLTSDDTQYTVEELFARLSKGRSFRHVLGEGASNVIRTNSLDYLAPRPMLGDEALRVILQLSQDGYQLPLSYDLILQAIRSLQIDRDYKMSIVHAATAVEVHVLHLMHRMLVIDGRSETEAWSTLENDPDYEGVAKRLRQLEQRTQNYAEKSGSPRARFVGGGLHHRWKTILAHKRNRAVHAGISSFKWAEGAEAIGIAKETIVFLDQRVPAVADQVILNPTIDGLSESAGGIVF